MDSDLPSKCVRSLVLLRSVGNFLDGDFRVATFVGSCLLALSVVSRRSVQELSCAYIATRRKRGHENRNLFGVVFYS